MKPETSVLGTDGAECEDDGLVLCTGSAQKRRLVCSDGLYGPAPPCSPTENCDRLSGACLPVIAECAGKALGFRYCDATGNVQVCGPDLVRAEREECSGTCRDGACVPKPEAPPAEVSGRCGDGAVQPGEACDDGNGVDDDACSNTCARPACGDGVVQAGEACDDGNAVDNDVCSNACSSPRCGDRIVQAGEACDDGNASDDDGCSSACTVPGCGDGVTQAEEECDDGNAVNTDTCTVACREPRCGDSFTQPGETCDDGNIVDDDGCSNSCKRPMCGDGILSADETCEDGNRKDGDGCSASCQIEQCGDGKKTGIEECDDGNRVDNDGCSALCRNETCGDGVVQRPREECEDRNTVDTDLCRNGCKNAASLNALSNACVSTPQITQTVCMVAVAVWCKQFGNAPVAGMVTGQKNDNEYTVGCITGVERKEVATTSLDGKCGGGHQQSPACLERVDAACEGLGFRQGFYVGSGSSNSMTAVACGTGTKTVTENVPACNGIADADPVPVTCAKALADKCGSGKGGMIQARARNNQVTYTCFDLPLTGSARLQ